VIAKRSHPQRLTHGIRKGGSACSRKLAGGSAPGCCSSPARAIACWSRPATTTTARAASSVLLPSAVGQRASGTRSHPRLEERDEAQGASHQIRTSASPRSGMPLDEAAGRRSRPEGHDAATRVRGPDNWSRFKLSQKRPRDRRLGS